MEIPPRLSLLTAQFHPEENNWGVRFGFNFWQALAFRHAFFSAVVTNRHGTTIFALRGQVSGSGEPRSQRAA
jgi:hypothetical protein